MTLFAHQDSTAMKEDQFSARVRATAAAAALLATLAASPGRTQTAEAVPASPAASLEVVDRRPVEDSQTKYLSMALYSCNYGVLRVGDEGQSTDRLSRLKSDIEAALGDAAAGKSLVVNRYAVHYNSTRYLRGEVSRSGVGEAAIASTGVLPAALGAAWLSAQAQKGQKICPKERMLGGWYALDELSTPHSPLIVELSVTFDGKAYDTRKVLSLTDEETNEFRGIKGPKLLAQAFTATNQELIAMLRPSAS